MFEPTKPDAPLTKILMPPEPPPSQARRAPRASRRHLVEAHRPALAQRLPRREADDERRARVGRRDRGRLAGDERGDERLPLADVARGVALEVEVRQLGPARPLGR